MLRQFRAACKALVADEPEPRPKEKKKTDSGMFGLTAALIWRITRRAVTITAKLAPGASAAIPSTPATATIRAKAYEQAAACLDDTLDSMNPYCEPDAYLTEIDGDDYNNQPPQEYYLLQL